MTSLLPPILALIIWTFVIWVAMYATRLPAMSRARINPRVIKRSEDLDALPVAVKQIADNYNHLHEQPVLFYALALACQLAALTGPLMVGLAWAYVALRVVHSLIQCTINYVPLRFAVFVLASLVLMVMTGSAAIAIF